MHSCHRTHMKKDDKMKFNAKVPQTDGIAQL